MKTIGTRISISRKALNWSQKRLAAECGWADGPGEGQSRISGYERNLREPNSTDIRALAKALKVSAGWLATGDGPVSLTDNVADTTGHYTAGRRYPVISYVTAGNWEEAIDPYQPGDAESWRVSTADASTQSFFLRVHGDSMYNPSGSPSIPDGALILVDPEAEAMNGSLVVAKLEDTNEVTFKKLVIELGHRYLQPLNPRYEQIQVNGNCRIIGVAVKMEMDL